MTVNTSYQLLKSFEMGFSSFLGVMEIADAGKCAKNTIRNQNINTRKKVLLVGTDVLFILARGTEMYETLNRNIFGRDRIIVKIVSIGSRCVRSVVSNPDPLLNPTKLDAADLLATTIRSVTEVLVDEVFKPPADSVKVLTNDLFRSPEDSTRKISGRLMSWTQLAHQVSSACARVISIVKFFNGMNLRNNRSEQNERREAGEQDQQRLFELKAEAQRELLEAETIEDLRSIPLNFIDDDVFSNYICGITKRRIRYIVVVFETLSDVNPIYYEKEAFNNWCQTHTVDKPPKWPVDLIFTVDSVVEDRLAQNLINNRLKMIFPREKQRVLRELAEQRSINPTPQAQN